VYCLAATLNRLLWYWDGDPANVESLPYAMVGAFGFDSDGGVFALRVARLDVLSSELAAATCTTSIYGSFVPHPSLWRCRRGRERHARGRDARTGAG
jgi:hypothetical protein